MDAVVAFLTDLGNGFAAVLAAALAVGAAGHAVLFKRDSRAAAGWVGLIVLAPVVGPVLYAMLGVNRIRRSANELRSQSPRLTGQYAVLHAAGRVLERALDPEHHYLIGLGGYVDRVTGRPLTEGNAIRPLQNGDEAYPAMLRAID